MYILSFAWFIILLGLIVWTVYVFIRKRELVIQRITKCSNAMKLGILVGFIIVMIYIIWYIVSIFT